jgi:hypothetical protein
VQDHAVPFKGLEWRFFGEPYTVLHDCTWGIRVTIAPR